MFCDQAWDKVEPGPCPGRPGLDREADLSLTVAALEDRYLRLHEQWDALVEVCEPFATYAPAFGGLRDSASVMDCWSTNLPPLHLRVSDFRRAVAAIARAKGGER